MSIYIIKNEQNEEVSAYTDLHRAKDLAEQLESDTHHYCIEELNCEMEHETKLSGS